MKKQTLRIIGGEHKRRTISFADIDGLRPTPDRLRETLFNWLMHDIGSARVLDVCAGSGALSWEALSRGASHVSMIEPNRKQVSYLKRAITDLKCTDSVSLIPKKAETALSKLPDDQPFDVIFVDPPYGLNLWGSLLASIFDNQLIHADTLIYIEADKPHDQLNISTDLMKQLDPLKETQVGQITATLYRVTL